MNLSLADKIATAVLYEGYVLYPYRPDTFKNRQRWTFGGLFPSGYSDSERSFGQTECLLLAQPDTRLEVHVRGLQLQNRTVGRLLEPLAASHAWDPACPPSYVSVPTLTLGERTLYGWQEAVEQTASFRDISLADLLTARQVFDFEWPAWQASEPVPADTGEIVGVIVRQRQAVHGRLELTASQSDSAGLIKLTARVSNRTELPNPRPASRDEAALWSLASVHLLLGLHAGQFLSATAPPEPYRAAAAACEQAGLWPVLVGEPGQSDLMLAAPIILYDHPQIAPESAGDLFDGTEIDEILSLRILTLTEAEKAAMREIDERTRALLDRTEALSDDDWARLHGTLRGLKSLEAAND
jgi:hypothetical protein